MANTILPHGPPVLSWSVLKRVPITSSYLQKTDPWPIERKDISKIVFFFLIFVRKECWGHTVQIMLKARQN